VTTTPDQKSKREIRAPGPSPDPEQLRTAYLGLLKMCLCDLAGAQTLTVSRMGSGRDPDQTLFTRELKDDELWVRIQGFDWPWSGLTMVGLERLDDLQSCVEQAVADDVEGDLIEAGVWRGGASILMRATLDSLGETDRTVWVADSFQGLPPPDQAFPEDRGLDLSWIGFLAASVDEVRAHFTRFGCERGVNFVKGYFAESLPALKDHRWSIVRIDGDTYEATWTALECLYPGLSPGGYLIVDDYQVIEECRAAVGDFRREAGVEEPLEMIDRMGARWRRLSDAPVRPTGTRETRRMRKTRSAQSRNVKADPHLPSLQEVHLAAEVNELREHIAKLQAEAEKTLGNRVRKRLRGGPRR
jgi:O-methyltransferase